jgi:hypothetical protein
MIFFANENMKLNAEAKDALIVLDLDTLNKISGAASFWGDAGEVEVRYSVDWRPKTPGNGV